MISVRRHEARAQRAQGQGRGGSGRSRGTAGQGRLRAASLGLLLAALLVAISTPPAHAQQPLPNSMAAVGDSLTRATGSGERYLADNTANSWATGGNPAINSVALRLATRNPALGGAVYNVARFGARMSDLRAQMATVNAVGVEFVTVQIGGNDACALTEAAMTPVDGFRRQFSDAMALLAEGSPQARVLVMSLPDPTKLLPLFRDNPRAVLIWDAFDICRAALDRPNSNEPADVARRERVRQRIADYNRQLAEVCAQYPRCRYDGGAMFSGTLEAADVSPFDFFHLSARGQARLAELAWATAGFGP